LEKKGGEHAEPTTEGCDANQKTCATGAGTGPLFVDNNSVRTKRGPGCFLGGRPWDVLSPVYELPSGVAKLREKLSSVMKV